MAKCMKHHWKINQQSSKIHPHFIKYPSKIDAKSIQNQSKTDALARRVRGYQNEAAPGHPFGNHFQSEIGTNCQKEPKGSSKVRKRASQHGCQTNIHKYMCKVWEKAPKMMSNWMPNKVKKFR